MAAVYFIFTSVLYCNLNREEVGYNGGAVVVYYIKRRDIAMRPVVLLCFGGSLRHVIFTRFYHVVT